MNRSLLSAAVGALLRRPAKALSLSLGLALVVVLLGAVIFLSDALRAEAGRVRSAMPEIVVQQLVAGRPTVIDARAQERIRTLPSVRAVRPRAWGYVFLPALQGNVTVVGMGPAAASLGDFSAALSSGRDLNPAAHEMLMGAALAQYLGLRVGDELALPGSKQALKLVGLFHSSVDLYTVDVVLCSDADARTLLGLKEQEAVDLAVDVINPDESRVIAAAIVKELPGARVIERAAMERGYMLTYGRRAGFVLAACIPAMLALLVLAWDRLSGLGDRERREIAIMKAVGFGTRDVVWLKLTESFLVGAGGTLVGLLGAYAWVFWLGAPGLRGALVGWSVLYPSAPLTPMVDVPQLLGIALTVIGSFLLVSVVPAWRAAMADPMEVMRGA
jgi:ABC-type lipoprotein release transport system permease subunit